MSMFVAVNTLSPCFEVFRVKSEALCALTVRLLQRSYTLHCLQPPNVNKRRLCSIALTIVLNISQGTRFALGRDLGTNNNCFKMADGRTQKNFFTRSLESLWSLMS